MIHKRITRVDIQVSLLAGILVIISCSMIYLIHYTMSYHDMIESLQDRVVSIYSYLEDTLEVSTFDDINTIEDEKTLLYQEMKEKLANVKMATGVRYLYTAKQNHDGEYIYLIDGLPATNTDFRHVGDLIEPEIIPDIEYALEGNAILPDEIKSTSWGYIFISYLPISSGDRIVGVVGIEFAADHQYRTYMMLKIITPLVIILACILAIITAFIIFKRISNPTYQDFANTDMLTGLKNRNAFDIDLNNLTQRERLEGVGLICFDLDFLKRVNDTLGHQAGDRYIQAACSFFKEFVKCSYVLYRIGGDEFAAIVKDFDENAIAKSAEAMMKYSREQREDAAGEPFPSLSIGYAMFDQKQDRDLSDTLKRADVMMYENKKGKQRLGG